MAGTLERLESRNAEFKQKGEVEASREGIGGSPRNQSNAHAPPAACTNLQYLAAILSLLAQLAALPPDQRAILSKLLSPPTHPNDAVDLDDSLPRGFEKSGNEGGLRE